MAQKQHVVPVGPYRHLAVLVALLLVGFVASGAAQVRTVTLYGKVVDASGGVLPGATVTVTSAQLITGAVSQTTDATGQWHVPNLPPGDYTVTVELSGFTRVRREHVVADAGAQIGVDLSLTVSGIKEDVTVLGAMGSVDVLSSRAVRALDSKLIDAVPFKGRTYEDVILALPGITDGNRYTYSLAQTVQGSGVRDNDYVLDGQSAKHPSGYSGSEFSIEAFEEVQVTTGGISAEFGQSSGGVFSFITKSGGDTLHGSVYAQLLDNALQANNVSAKLEAQGILKGNAIVSDFNAGGNLGGPIIRKHLWFFLDYNRATNEESIAGFPGNVEQYKRLIFTKGSWQVAPQHRLVGSFNHMRRWMLPSNPGAQYRVDNTTWRKQYWLPKVISVQWTSVLGNNALLEAQGGALKVVEDNTFPYGSFDPLKVNGYNDLGSGVNYGTWDTSRGRFDGRNHWDLKTNFSYYIGDFLGGKHDFKTGLHREKGWVQRWQVIPNNLLQRLRSAATCLSFDCTVPLDVQLYAGPSDNKHEYVMWAAYAQDQWTLPRGLTLNPGIRFEYTNGWTPEQRQGADVVPNGFDPDLDGKRNTFPVMPWFPSVTWPERDKLVLWKAWAPRIGVSWDPMGSARFVVKGSYGRWFNKPSEVIGSGNPNSLTNSRYEWLDCRSASGTRISCQGLPLDQVNGDRHFQDGEQGRLLSTSYRTPEQFAGTLTHDPNLKPWYVDGVNIGFETAIRRDLSLSVTGIYKRHGDIIGQLDPSRRPFDTAFDPVEVINPLSGKAMTIYLEKPQLGSVPTQTYFSNPPEAKGKYRGVEFTVRKRYSDGWQFLGSYLLGKGEGNIPSTYDDGSTVNVTTPNELINAYGPVSLDATHQIKLSGSFSLRYGINLGLSYLGQTGYPSLSYIRRGDIGGASNFAFLRGVHYPEFDASGRRYRESQVLVSIEPRGTNRLDFRNQLNLRVEKTFTLKAERSLGVSLDVLNVFNSAAVTHVQSQTLGFVNYMLPELIESPLRARVGFRLRF